MQREKGVLTKDCTGCSSQLELVVQADGSSAYASCGNCYPATAEQPAEPENQDELVDEVKTVVTETASAPFLRELGTKTEEDEK